MTNIEYINGGAIHSEELDLTREQIKAAKELLLAGLELHRKQAAYDKIAPEGSYSQFYGNWNILRIKKIKNLETQED